MSLFVKLKGCGCCEKEKDVSQRLGTIQSITFGSDRRQEMGGDEASGEALAIDSTASDKEEGKEDGKDKEPG